MKILLFGKNGQVGTELQRSLAPLGMVIAPSRDDRTMCGDLNDLAGLAQTIRAVAPDVIVNAAAYTAVDKAESEQEQAFLINAQAPAIMAQQAQLCGARLVHYSTDYVFDGSGTKPWLETDIPHPLNVYGASKLEGEKAVIAASCRHFIIRSSWICASHGHNFLKTVLRLGQERDRLTMIDDQIGAPTTAALVADTTARMLLAAAQRPEVSGLYHLAASGETSWYNYARFILDSARMAGMTLKVMPGQIVPIPSSEYPTPARRPLNSRLDTMKITGAFGLSLPNWQSGIARILPKILE